MHRLKNLFILFLVISMTFMPLQVTAPAFAETVYDFSDEAQERFNSSIEQTVNVETIKEKPKSDKKTKKTKKAQNKEIKLKKGLDFDIALQTAIHSANLAENSTIAASLEEDIVSDSHLIAPQGSIVYGKVLKVKPARGFYGKGSMQITFDEIMLPNGEVLNFSGNVIKIKTRGSRALRIGCDVLIGVVGGALAGSSMVALAPVGAAIGLFMAAVAAAETKGTDVEIPAGTSLTIRLVKTLKTLPYA